MTGSRYSAMQFIAVGTIHVSEQQPGEFGSVVSQTENTGLDKLLSEGWELIELLTHRAEKGEEGPGKGQMLTASFTAIVAVIGKPAA